MAELSPDQKLLSDFLRVPKSHRKNRARTGLRVFSQFSEEHMTKVAALVNTFEETFSSTKSFSEVIKVARKEAETEDLELVQHAVSQFVAKNRETRRTLRIPPLVARSPREALRNRESKFGPEATADVDRRVEDGTLSARPQLALQLSIESPQERLNWWKEDPTLNEHHEHYHMVFPWVGSYKDRQGELFIYMHKQMLARYDAERRALGMQRVTVLSNFSEQLEGYTPHKELREGGSRGTPYTARPPNAQIRSEDVARLEAWRNAIRQAINDGRYGTAQGQIRDLTPDALGSMIERSNALPLEVRSDGNTYGNIHNMGHGAIDRLSVNSAGVIGSPRTACRDPVFWRWHKFVDELYNEWTNRHNPVNFSDAPPVRVNGVFFEDRPQLDRRQPSAKNDKYAAYAQSTYGGAKFTERDIPTATNELQTMVARRSFPWPEDSRMPDTINYVLPKEWVYFIRLTNTENRRVPVTVRIFIVPKDFADDRKAWIEMDKFSYEVAANAQTVVARPMDDSAVIRKPALKTAAQMDTLHDPNWSDEDEYCDCGWPFNLLLPRGITDGLPYTLLAMVTDGNIDQPIQQNVRCGSVTFCGNRDVQFPDRRPMGYPFHTPFQREGDRESHRATFANAPHAFLRDFTIRHVTSFS